MQESIPAPSLTKKLLCWGVHFYTSLGLVCAAAIAVLIIAGTPAAFYWSFALMFLATFIDATDGTMARALDIKKVVPGFDGRRLDDIIDFLTYTFLPIMLMWRANVLGADPGWCLILPLMASIYGFCQTKIKTDDGYFLGFPSYWNLVAFYLYMMPAPPAVSVSIVVVLALLTFVPTRYLYPSMGGAVNIFTNVLAVVWSGLLVWAFMVMPDGAPSTSSNAYWVTVASLFFPLWYMGASWFITIKLWMAPKRRFDAIIWDMDGTLVYSELLHLSAYQQVLGAFGIEFSEQEYDQFAGATDAEIAAYLLQTHGNKLQLTAEQLLTAKEAAVAELIKKQVTLAPGVLHTLEKARSLGLRMAVASSSTLQTIELVLTSLNIRHFFEQIASGEEVAKSKPAPDVFELAALRLRVDKKRCLAFEDSKNGTRAAAAALMYCVAVPSPWTAHHDFSAANVIVAELDSFNLEGILTLAA